MLDLCDAIPSPADRHQHGIGWPHAMTSRPPRSAGGPSRVTPSTPVGHHRFNGRREPDAERRERLLDLAYDISSRLRHHADPAVRVSAALLLAASLASCGGDSADDPTSGDGTSLAEPVAEPLTEEVRSGLPMAPGRYPLVENSLRRDEQGVYHFGWREPGATEGPGIPASASLARLAEASQEALEVPVAGDPILHLRHNSQIALASAANPLTPTTSRVGGVSPGFVYWRPLWVGSGISGPAYYDPPRVVASSGMVDGARTSTTPPAPAQRTYGLAHAVSGRAGGTGSGTAASSRSGGDASSGGRSGIAGPNSSSFSGGAASAKSGASSS